MQVYTYENHVMKDPLLPFIFYRQHIVSVCNHTPNWHTNMEMLYCIGGEGFIRCGATVTDFRPGDIFVVNPDVPHNICSNSEVRYRCLIVDNSFCVENGIPIGQLVFQASIQNAMLCALFEAVAEAYAQKEPDDFRSVLNIRQAVLTLLTALCWDYATMGKKDDPSNEYVRKAISYIRQNMNTNIKLDEVSDYVGISKHHLSRLFKTYTGNSLIYTANLIRCTEARHLIEGGMQVCEAAAACGYDNLSYFTRIFRKYFQENPSYFKI